jgi:hypothetical protein
MRARFRAPALSAAAIMAGLVAAPVQAQEKTNYSDMYENLKSAVGLGKTREAIDYSPRAPIVVPPVNNLPPPVDERAEHPANFPVDPDVTARRQALMDPRRPTPFADGSATGAQRKYLIDPPARYFDASAGPAAKDADTASEKPQKKHRHHTAVAPAQ